MALITAAEARTHIPELTGSAEDAVLDILIAAVGATLAAWCGYPPPTAGGTPTLESASYVEFVDGPGGRWLQLPTRPVTAIGSIYDDTAWSWGASTLVASGDYAINDGREGLVLLTETATHGSWSVGRRAVKASYTAGYSTVPADIKEACRVAVRAVWDLRRTQGKANVSGGNVSLSLQDEKVVIDVARELLQHRRLPRAWL